MESYIISMDNQLPKNPLDLNTEDYIVISPAQELAYIVGRHLRECKQCQFYRLRGNDRAIREHLMSTDTLYQTWREVRIISPSLDETIQEVRVIWQQRHFHIELRGEDIEGCWVPFQTEDITDWFNRYPKGQIQIAVKPLPWQHDTFTFETNLIDSQAYYLWKGERYKEIEEPLQIIQQIITEHVDGCEGCRINRHKGKTKAILDHVAPLWPAERQDVPYLPHVKEAIRTWSQTNHVCKLETDEVADIYSLINIAQKLRSIQTPCRVYLDTKGRTAPAEYRTMFWSIGEFLQWVEEKGENTSTADQAVQALLNTLWRRQVSPFYTQEDCLRMRLRIAQYWDEPHWQRRISQTHTLALEEAGLIEARWKRAEHDEEVSQQWLAYRQGELLYEILSFALSLQHRKILSSQERDWLSQVEYALAE